MAFKVILIVALIVYVTAEPPVGEGYSSGPAHSDVGHRSLSQEYTAPAFGSRSSNYDAKARLSQQYGAPTSRLASPVSQTYGVPNARISQEYGPPSFRDVSSKISENYGAPRSINQDYGLPQFNSADSLSTSYGTPLQKSLSQEYGVPSQRNTSPSDKYGPPNFRKAHSTVSRTYGVPSPSSYGRTASITSPNSRLAVSESYGAPRSISTQYGAPNARNFDSYSASPKTSYLPSQLDSYDAQIHASSTEYGAPERSLNTNAILSSYESLRSSPSEKYGPPSARMPSDQYGVPEHHSSLSNQGYNYARNALDELLNQEPANYDFDYKVNDIVTGSDFGHKETRQENKAEGSYFVVLPDGTKQVVEYEADERGFKPRISVEPADFQGYDDNASNLERSGPY